MANGKKELTYVIVPDGILRRGLVGEVVQNLPNDLEVVALRMFVPSQKRAIRFREVISPSGDETQASSRALRAYLDREYVEGPGQDGKLRRALFIALYGEHAREKIEEATGTFFNIAPGQKIRGKFALFDQSSETITDPALFICPAHVYAKNVKSRFSVWTSRPYDDNGIVEKVADSSPQAKEDGLETTLALIKPHIVAKNAFYIGAAWGLFEKAGLYLVGAYTVTMSLALASRFYPHVRDNLTEKGPDIIRPDVERIVRSSLPYGELVPDDALKAISRQLAPSYAAHEYRQLLHAMTGIDPNQSKDPSKDNTPGTARIIAIVYRGPKAVESMREKLGKTNPNSADANTVRRLLGEDSLRNAAHASDSVERAQQEIRLLGLRERRSLYLDLKPYMG